jgi:hypothetical protein
MQVMVFMEYPAGAEIWNGTWLKRHRISTATCAIDILFQPALTSETGRGRARRKAEIMTGKNKQPADPTKRKLDELLEEGLESTFPASDPVAVTQPAATLPEDDFVPETKTESLTRSSSFPLFSVAFAKRY